MISQSQLESYLWGAATLLRGYIDAGDYKQFIFPLLFYKRLCDVYDEELADALEESGGDQEYAALPEQHRFQIPEDAHWKATRTKVKNVGKAIQDALRAIETANPDTLYGVFGDAQWTNKDRLPDRMLRELIEHFSSQTLSLSNCPEDELGVGYEFLIKKFADDSGHTAAEFYTNRTVVHLMTEMLEPKPGESIYDPTCGSAGMLLSAVAHLKRQNKEWRNLRLFGQERNLLTSAIGRMNLFLHGVEDFQIIDLGELAERDIEDGRLRDYDALYVADPCVPAGVCARIRAWVREGGRLYGSTAAASRDEYNAAHDGLADVFGIAARVEVQVQPGRFDVRGGLNDLPWLDRVSFPAGGGDFGALGMKAKAAAAGAAVTGVFADGAPAVFAHRAGKGAALYVATCPALSYAKDAGFVPAELKEKWPAAQRGFLTAVARESGAPRLVELSHPVVEAGVFESARGAALILANFTYEPIARLEIRMPLKAPPARVVSLEHGPLPFAAEASGAALAAAGYGLTARCAVALGLDDIVLFE